MRRACSLGFLSLAACLVACSPAPADRAGDTLAGAQPADTAAVLRAIDSTAARMTAAVNGQDIATMVKQEKRENRRKSFPITLIPFDRIREWERFDSDSGKDLGVEIREYFIPDFSNCKDHDAFEDAFARLLRDLREERRQSTEAGAPR